MSIASQITRIQTDRNTIRNKLVELGLATNVDNLDTLAEAVDGIVDNGNVSVQVKEGETYTIPAGYHSGSGTVSGVAGGGNYSIQSKTVIPTKKQQQVTPDDGYYGLSDVTVNAIPDAYQDVTAVTAGAGDVLTGKTIVSNTGVIIAGTMTNNGAVDKTLTTEDASYTVPAGYHSGAGTVKIVPEEKSTTPTKAVQNIVATNGKVLSKVTINAIPDNFVDTTDATATAEQILEGETAYVGSDKVEGTMPNNGAVSSTLDATNGKQSYAIPAGYHDGKGAVSIVLEQKSATPTKNAQSITPATGKVLSKVTVEAIPAAYQDVTSVDAEAAHVLDGKKIVTADGTVVTGSMANNGAISGSIDGLTTMSFTVPAGYTTGGTVTLTSDIEDALAAI
jgi:hypothetical protein